MANASRKKKIKLADLYTYSDTSSLETALWGGKTLFCHFTVHVSGGVGRLFSYLLGSFLLPASFLDYFVFLLYSLAYICQSLAVTAFPLEELCESINFLLDLLHAGYQCLTTGK